MPLKDTDFDEIINSLEFKEMQRKEFPYSAVALAVLEVRARLQITQKQLADLVGTTESVISKLESGKHPISTVFLRRIADATNSEIHISLEERK